MPEPALPVGHYLFLNGRVRPGMGGQTRAVLMRSRLFAQYAGVFPRLLTTDASPKYPRRRERLRAEGLLLDGVELLNIYEWHAEREDQSAGEGRRVSAPSARSLVSEELREDGSLFSAAYASPGLRTLDIYRPDGSLCLRIRRGPRLGYRRPWPVQVRTLDREGRVVRTFGGWGDWYRSWLTELAPAPDRVFVLSDNRKVLHHLLPVTDARFHVVHLMHNPHVLGARHWNSALAPSYVPLLESIEHLDGLISLTRRQRDAVAKRFGATTNLFVVPNPVEAPRPPDPLPVREPRRFAVVARLIKRKRVEHALRALALVLEEEPGVRLDVYGGGDEAEFLAAEAKRLGIEESVTLHGYSTQAREALWAATGFLMTSTFEGYPLATLESMSHGCPVISYDIAYGPREQISDGVDGFLVPRGDIRAVADRMLRLLREPGLAAQMSRAAFDKAAGHGHTAFLADWRHVLETVVANKDKRTELESVRLRVDRLVVGTTVSLDAALTLDGRSRASSLDSLVVSLDAVPDRTTSVVSIPVDVVRDQARFRVTATFDPAQVRARVGPREVECELRLRVVWENSAWQTRLKAGRGRPVRF